MKNITLKLRWRLALSAIAVATAVASSANAAVINGLFNTGVDNTTTTLVPHGAPDPHYTITAPAGFPTVTVDDTTFPFPPWVANTYGVGGSRWIGPDRSSQGPAGPYTYQTTFNLPSNAILSTAMITGLWGTDDASSDIWLNGVPQSQVSAGFTSLVPFMVSSGFQIGLNTLEFRLFNSGGPTGLRVDKIAGKYQVPEPASVALTLFAVAGTALALFRTRSGGQP
jgi:hypothetical protein